MKSYSQNHEDIFVLDYFKDFKGTLLEIGANDGKTLSNSLLLIENGWNANLIEPGYVNYDLCQLHKLNKNVVTYDVAIGDSDKIITFYESGSHIQNGTDKGLVSTTNINEMLRWPEVEFTERLIYMVSWESFYEQHLMTPKSKIDFLSIDCEGQDWNILQQIDLSLIGCKVLIIEWNSEPRLMKLFTEYCAGYGLELRHSNAENLIFCK